MEQSNSEIEAQEMQRVPDEVPKLKQNKCTIVAAIVYHIAVNGCCNHRSCITYLIVT